MLTDEILRLGPEGRLLSIATRPARALPAAPGVVILNAGVLHRVGPHRLHVNLARELAGRGIPSLRMDLGGIGDSTPDGSAATFRDSAVLDTRIALAAFAPKSIIFGVCAGADNAIATALVDDRVAGIVLVDPHTYASRMSQVRALRARIERDGAIAFARAGVRAAIRVGHARLERLRDRGNPGEPVEEGRTPPPLAEFRSQLRSIVDRGVRVCAVYSGVHGAGYNHADQLFEVVPELRGRVDVRYYPDANHTFTEIAHQAELIRDVVAWVTSRFV